ncbi:ice-structuring glycoprotein [Drosophila innubila]|uniref:ice-structuring glycoprotein n=1 Tax=Drosophila innubila TaxID=198719 RepID=UPI00148B8947|nr:ice-structuring glycoprotein [Drosophila innubila]
MFTNWLTGSSSSSSSRVAATTVNTMAVAGVGSAVAVAGVSGGGGIGSVMSTPPDVILEVGPAPSSVRFVAHALVLGMHSGYLRSAIRMDEATVAAATATTTAATVAATPASHSGELLLYLGNVTAEQFAPLLTYMYTGYLDLNVDNIFAVLLATHVLHMPRALEICRSYLARAQTEGYLSGQQQQLPLPVASVAPKIIRPIASKATLPNFGFLPAPPPPPNVASVSSVATSGYLQPAVDATAELSIAASAAAAVDAVAADEEDEDVEVFIDSNTATDNELDTEDCNVSVVSSLGSSSAASSLNIERVDVKRTPTPTTTPTMMPANVAATTQPKHVTATATTTKQRRSSSNNNNNNNTTRKSLNNKRGNCRSVASATTGLQVAKAPVSALQLEMATPPTTTSKFIIDVASCDGPVRFRRILNTAYGHKPETCNNAAVVELQRTQQSVSYSFHQQMARAISSQQRQQQQEENENSGDTAAAAAAAPNVTATTAASTVAVGTTQRKQTHSELFVCVYCKHTFKSQYCYQKHAKRHLNPLSLDKKLTEAPHAATSSSSSRDNSAAELLAAAAATTTATAATAAAGVAAAATAATVANVTGADATLSAAALLLRREVRPLDMNVQYYPCKTCGSKFPSYYFVHKHRKLCHADELEATTTSTSNNNNNSTSSNSNSSNSGITKREATTATATATAAETTP